MVHKFTVEFPETIWQAIQEKKGKSTIKDFLIRLIEKELEISKIKVFILAGGEGARLKPLTESIPKAMIPVSYKPLLEYNLELLEKSGISEVFLLIGHLGSRIMKYFGQQWNNINLSYISETTALDTAGAIDNVRNLISNTFIVMNSDILTNINILEIIKFHNKTKNVYPATICGIEFNNYFESLNKSNEKSYYEDFGVFQMESDDDGSMKITKFEEKPSKLPKTSYINTGIYIFEPEILSYLKDSKGKSISGDLLPKLIADRKLNAYICDKNTFWLDVAHPARWSKAWDELFSSAIEI